jgi:hypothetical protein
MSGAINVKADVANSSQPLNSVTVSCSLLIFYGFSIKS